MPDLVTYPRWPADVPTKPERDPWRKTRLGSPITKSGMAAGSTRRRRQYTVDIEDQRLSIVLTEPQYRVFEDFYRNTIKGTISQFWMPVWSVGEFVSRLVILDDENIEISQPFFLDGAPAFRVSMQLQIRIPAVRRG